MSGIQFLLHGLEQLQRISLQFVTKLDLKIKKPTLISYIKKFANFSKSPSIRYVIFYL
jgi:hypothetical protein